MGLDGAASDAPWPCALGSTPTDSRRLFVVEAPVAASRRVDKADELAGAGAGAGATGVGLAGEAGPPRLVGAETVSCVGSDDAEPT